MAGEISVGLSLVVGGAFLPKILESLNLLPNRFNTRESGGRGGRGGRGGGSNGDDVEYDEDDNVQIASEDNNGIQRRVTKQQFALFHTFKYTTSSLMVASGAAVVGHVMGFDRFLGSLSPPVSLMLTALPLCGTTYLLVNTNRKEEERKKTLFTLFNLLNGLSFSCVYGFLPSAIVLKAGIYTASLFTGISAGALLSSFSSASLQLPTLFGMSFLALVSLAENVWSGNKTLREMNLYVGLVIVFATCMYDMKRLQEKARDTADVDSIDYINESIDFFLNFLNIFVRILRILIEQEIEKRKKELEEQQKQQNHQLRRRQ